MHITANLPAIILADYTELFIFKKFFFILSLPAPPAVCFTGCTVGFQRFNREVPPILPEVFTGSDRRCRRFCRGFPAGTARVFPAGHTSAALGLLPASQQKQRRIFRRRDCKIFCMPRPGSIKPRIPPAGRAGRRDPPHRRRPSAAERHPVTPDGRGHNG